MLDAGQVAFVVPEDGVEVTQGVVVYVLGDPVTHGAVQSRQLFVVLAAAAGGGALRRGAVDLLGFDITGGGATKHQP